MRISRLFWPGRGLDRAVCAGAVSYTHLKRIRHALEDSRENNLAVEKLFTPYIWAQEMALHLFSVVILAAAVWLYLNGSLSLANALMAVIISFLIFSQIQSAGSGVSALRPVSYTHLDVYKRQPTRSCWAAARRIKSSGRRRRTAPSGA